MLEVWILGDNLNDFVMYTAVTFVCGLARCVVIHRGYAYTLFFSGYIESVYDRYTLFITFVVI